MKKLPLLLIIFLACIRPVSGQVISIIDDEDMIPVQGVAVMNTDRTEYYFSDKQGKIDLSALAKYNEVCFHHFTYEYTCLTIGDIEKAGYTVKLKRKLFEIEEFVVSANRWEQSRREVPNRIATISLPVLTIQNPQTSADLIGLTGEVFIQKSQLGGGSPMIRGFATNRVLIVVDGVRMNNAIYREGNIQNIISIDPLSVESSEVIFGPGAVVYGSDAIGGVMDFHTLKPHFSTDGKPLLKAGLVTRYSTANNERTIHFDFNVSNKKISFLSGISYSGFSDLLMGSRGNDSYLRPEYVTRIAGRDTVVANKDPEKQVSSGYSQVYTLNKLRFKLSDHSELILSNHYSGISDIPRYDRLIQYRNGALRYGDWYYGPQVWVMSSADFSDNRSTAAYDRLRVLLSHQHYRESRHDRAFGKNIINEQEEKVSILSLNIDLDKNLNDKGSMAFYGIEAVTSDIKSVAATRNIIDGTILPAGPRYPDGLNRYSSFSLYGGYRTNPGRTTGFTTGLRYNYVSLFSEIEDNSFYGFPFTEISIANGSLTGSAGLTFNPGTDTHAGINLSTGFRAPNLDDAGKVFESAPGVVVVPNPDLRPEYAWNIDMNLSGNFGSLLYTDVSAFFTWLDNALVRHDFLFNGSDSILYQGELSKVEALTNSGYAVSYGLHLKAQANITSFMYLKSSLTITRGHEQGKIPLRHVAPVFGSSHLVFKMGSFESDLYSVYNGPKPYEKMAPSEISKAYLYAADENGNPWSPGWITLNLKMNYKFRNFATVTGGIENILNERYRPYSSGIVAAGRNFIVSLRLQI